MSQVAVAAGGRPALRGRLGTEAQPAAARPDVRRALQLVLAAIWLLDGVLQYQRFMYTKAFNQMLAATAAGNPSVIARPITWDATLVEHHLVLINTIFATIQLLLGLGIAFRPTVRVALAASIAWSLGVWWFGEGLGGVLSGAASPLNGAPGAVIIYALLAVLLWPADRPAVGALHRRPGGGRARRPGAVAGAVAEPRLLRADPGQPGAAGAERHDRGHGERRAGLAAGPEKGAASLVASQGLAASIVLAVALVLIAVGVYLPGRPAKATLVLAIVVAGLIWVVRRGAWRHPRRRARPTPTRARCSSCSRWPTGRRTVPAQPAAVPVAVR